MVGLSYERSTNRVLAEAQLPLMARLKNSERAVNTDSLTRKEWFCVMYGQSVSALSAPTVIGTTCPCRLWLFRYAGHHSCLHCDLLRFRRLPPLLLRLVLLLVFSDPLSFLPFTTTNYTLHEINLRHSQQLQRLPAMLVPHPTKLLALCSLILTATAFPAPFSNLDATVAAHCQLSCQLTYSKCFARSGNSNFCRNLVNDSYDDKVILEHDSYNRWNGRD